MEIYHLKQQQTTTFWLNIKCDITLLCIYTDLNQAAYNFWFVVVWNDDDKVNGFVEDWFNVDNRPTQWMNVIATVTIFLEPLI